MTRAQGKTRRWPDLLIGLLVLLLLGGFASLLLGQRSRPTSGAAPGATSAATEPADGATGEPITIPSAPGAGEATGTDETTTTAPELTASSGAQTPAEGTDPAVTAATSPDPAVTSSAETGDLAQVPAPPTEAAPTATDPAPPAQTTQTAPPATATPSAPAVAPRAGGTVTPSEARTPLRSDYRISLGSFATRRTAERLTQEVRDLGYTVYPIDVGEGVVAQVGPFADEATARQALADIQRAYPGAVVYPPRGRNLRQGGVAAPAPTPAAPTPPASSSGPATSAPATPAAPSAPAAAPETGPEAVPSPAPAASTPPNSPATATPAPGPSSSAPGAQATASGPVYLQVGAFDRVESAQRLVTELRAQGYVPTVNAPEGGKVTVLVGPFSGSALDGAEERLSSSGLDHFRVR